MRQRTTERSRRPRGEHAKVARLLPHSTGTAWRRRPVMAMDGVRHGAGQGNQQRAQEEPRGCEARWSRLWARAVAVRLARLLPWRMGEQRGRAGAAAEELCGFDVDSSEAATAAGEQRESRAPQRQRAERRSRTALPREVTETVPPRLGGGAPGRSDAVSRAAGEAGIGGRSRGGVAVALRARGGEKGWGAGT